MNILFFTHGKACATEGGTERTTITVASSLTNLYGCKCYSLYESSLESPKEDCFVEDFFWCFATDRDAAVSDLRDIIQKYKIDIIVNQGSFQHTRFIRKAIEGLSCYIVFAHHFEPSSEKEYFTWNHFKKQPLPRTIKGAVYYIYQLSLFPWLKKKRIKQLSAWYKESYECADQVVLLSRCFILPFCEFAHINNTSKFEIIPNGLSFTEYLSQSELLNKKKVVLIVARLDDKYKNISLALKVWKRVKKDSISKAWTLKIVGHGPDKNYFESIIKNENIPDVVLEGRQNPIPYYKDASIFLMTSNSESWGLTITEAMQFGVVPIALNTYASLPEIITNLYDGIIVQPNDLEAFESCILHLMSEADKRISMAKNAIDSSKRFSQEKIAGKWYDLFLNLLITKK